MKIRNGFVSNSSSSSFIIALPKNGCKTLGQLQDLLFENDTQYVNIYADLFRGEYNEECRIYGWPVSEVAGIVLGDIQNSVCYTSKDVEILSDIYSQGYTDEYKLAEEMTCRDLKVDRNYVYRLSQKEQDLFWEKEKEYILALSKETVGNFIENHKNSCFYVVEYSDNDGELATAMEHGNLFDRIPHLKISNH